MNTQHQLYSLTWAVQTNWQLLFHLQVRTVRFQIVALIGRLCLVNFQIDDVLHCMLKHYCRLLIGHLFPSHLIPNSSCAIAQQVQFAACSRSHTLTVARMRKCIVSRAAHEHAHLCTCTRTYAHERVHACTHIHMDALFCFNIYIYIYIYI